MTAREKSRVTKSRRYSQRFYIMAVFYLGTNREIAVGDRVVGVRSRDGRDLTGLRGCVHYVCDSDTPGHDTYVCDVSFEGSRWGSFRWSVCLGDIMPEEGVAEGSSPRRCACGCEITKDMVLGSRLNKYGMCDDCAKNYALTVEGYHNAKGFPYAYAKDKITLGVEIEIDDPEEEGDRKNVLEDVYYHARDNKYPLIMTAERDGSLNGDGMELVSVPLTINEWGSDMVKSQLNMLFDSADDNGFKLNGRTSSGLHVHIGRKDLCGMDREKSNAVGLLMGWAVTRLWNKGFKKLSRRTYLDYCHLLDNHDTCNGLLDTSACYDRYYAVNIENSKTIELRIFKGARCMEDVLVAVDVCYMLGKWATKKINAFEKRNSYSAKSKKYDDCLEYADRLAWSALVKYSKFPERSTLPWIASAQPPTSPATAQ